VFAAAVVLVAVALAAIQTPWAKEQLRQLIVRQANQYLTATLEIGRLGGSLLRGIELGNVRVSRQGEALIDIEAVSLSYSIRELFEGGTVIRRIALVRPRFLVERDADGRWNLGALIRRDAESQERRGPGRPLHLFAIEITDGSVEIREPLRFGAAHVPTIFTDLNLSFAFDYEPVAWTLAFEKASWTGRAPDLTVRHLAGRVINGGRGWTFNDLRVETPSSRFTLNGRIDRRTTPTQLALKVDAERFVFQEWSGIVPGLKNIAVDAEFETQLDGSPANLSTHINLRSDGGHIRGELLLDTTAPGWRGSGAVDVQRLQLARWLNRPDRPSDITGHVMFDLTDMALRAGGRFPEGSYSFDGSHARYLDYEADDLRARGMLSPDAVTIAEATGTAYGANLRVTDGSVGLDAPYPYRFVGIADGVDLRQVPHNAPVPHVESTLSFSYDVKGRFSSPFITGCAQFRESSFLGATIGAGAAGAIDTSATPLRYSGEGDIRNVDLGRFGRGLEVGWLQDPRYAGTLDGHFLVEGTGSQAATMTLAGSGRISRADLFDGRLTEGDVTIRIQGGSLEASYDGGLSTINPAVAFGDRRYDASLSGTARARVSVRDLIVRSPTIFDYTIDAAAALMPSRIRTLRVDSGNLASTLANGTLNIASIHVVSSAIDLQATGALELDGRRSSQIDYKIVRGDLALLEETLGRRAAGDLTTSGHLNGPLDRMRLVGEAAIGRLDVSGVQALSTDVRYDITVPSDAPDRAVGTVEGRASFIRVFGQELRTVSGTVSHDDGRIDANLRLEQQQLTGVVEGSFLRHREAQLLDVLTLSTTIQRSSWTLASPAAPRIGWNERGVMLSGLVFADAATRTQRLTIDGTWYPEGGGALRVIGRNVSLDALANTTGGPARYGGLANIDVTLSGTREEPIAVGQVAVTDGRIWRVAYESLQGRVGYADGAFQIDLRLDQRPGVWLTVVGRLPLAVLYRDRGDAEMDLTVRSTAIDLGLLEGATDVIRDVSGTMTLDVRVGGTSHDPHFDGRVDIAEAVFRVAASGVRYQRGRVALLLAADQMNVDTFHLEDGNGNALDVRGSLATHELRLSNLAIDVTARRFAVLRNEFGRMDIDAKLQLRGQFESPRLDGRITVAGGELNVDAILDRTMLQPYSVQPAGAPDVDAIAVLNPWDRLGLDIELNVPDTLRMVGDNVQISPGTPLGLGNISLRAIGDLYLYKDPAQPLYVTGSLDSVRGTYSFQGRRFNLDPASSINFRGDLTPELYVIVQREISGVDTRVTISGSLDAPELRLTSTPPLDPSDILSLIVFNTAVNQLNVEQQRDLVVRAGALAAGFLAAPLMGALERTLGLDTLEIEPGVDISGGARVTIGQEIAPGLVARFSRQFGEFEYDEAVLEYYLSRILRIRATFSDAGVSRSRFRRTERAGVDLLLFFSF
jgi:hypothetical protein